ncbi:hypothetical protein NHX12_022522 [Muraenolepis orangiensis]|uniref:Uncharacterized protein n=1 Tax=Muraenolepis orangiensis TaxID=630683 RepID=A0A9Q0ERR3_9TELE|nr:hypothetical protein NHX12_022522 [Muraenolepis orangiensis]
MRRQLFETFTHRRSTRTAALSSVCHNVDRLRHTKTYNLKIFPNCAVASSQTVAEPGDELKHTVLGSSRHGDSPSGSGFPQGRGKVTSSVCVRFSDHSYTRSLEWLGGSQGARGCGQPTNRARRPGHSPPRTTTIRSLRRQHPVQQQTLLTGKRSDVLETPEPRWGEDCTVECTVEHSV